ncbi:MAG: type I glyceraldehyde-3-phosphate dehydrogenase [Halobacteriovoraceae bacterium]|nr:type I glyceraldehyde-3-phosphate dehydrogenase [Halobacteriovoraceae bacterium]|tara:strand:+ start:24510 stop:25541 length:1032 start_codon:yes stop_codon:yes gene_type:complete
MSATKPIRLAINGMGRIGRAVIRELEKQRRNGNLQHVEIVAVNNPGRVDDFVRLMRRDSLHGMFPGDVELKGDRLHCGSQSMKFFTQRDPSEIDWSSEKVDIVIDATGIFKDKEGLGKHLNGTVKKVIMCAPGNDLDGTFVFGINHDSYNPSEHHIVSNASCTTNCLAPIAKVLHDSFGITQGFMTTVHAYTGDQNILDANHKDPRRARAAAMSMIPTSTGAAKAVGLVLPELKGKLDGYAVRVPTPDVSMVDLTVTLEKAATKDQINAAMKEAAETHLKSVLQFEDEPLVSVDFLGNPHSSIFDSLLTNVIGNQAKVVSWYDNEVGFSNRVVDLATFIGSKL